MSVTCSWCYKRGHNRLSCPERKKYCAANPDSHEAYVLRTEREGRQRTIAKRACTYCSEKGHNRRGCTALKEDKALVTKKNNEYRNHFISKLSENGLGPGALVCYAANEFHSSRRDEESIWDKTVSMVLTNISWGDVDFLQAPVIKATGGLLQNSFRFIGRKVAWGRVLKTTGWCKEDEKAYWHRNAEPAQNSLRPLTGYEVSCIIPDELPASFERNGGQGDMKILAPSYKSWTIPEKYENKLASCLESAFNFSPKANANDWEKRQMHRGEWVWLYPDRDRSVEAWHKEREKQNPQAGPTGDCSW